MPRDLNYEELLNILPDELWLLILDQLDVCLDLVSFAQTCNYGKRLAYSVGLLPKRRVALQNYNPELIEYLQTWKFDPIHFICQESLFIKLYFPIYENLNPIRWGLISSDCIEGIQRRCFFTLEDAQNYRFRSKVFGFFAAEVSMPRFLGNTAYNSKRRVMETCLGVSVDNIKQYIRSSDQEIFINDDFALPEEVSTIVLSAETDEISEIPAI